jgi:hypothetical protein
MRKRYRVLFFAALVAALVVPVGYALSVETPPPAATHGYGAVIPATVAAVAPATAAAAVAAPIAIRTGASASTSPFYQVPDAAKLFGIGTVLFGLAAAVRKAI